MSYGRKFGECNSITPIKKDIPIPNCREQWVGLAANKSCSLCGVQGHI